MEKFKNAGRLTRKFLMRPVGKATLVACLGGLFYGLGHALSGGSAATEGPRYLVASRDLPTGHPLGVKDMELRTGAGEVLPAGVYTDQKLHWVLGRQLLEEVKAGAWIREEILDGDLKRTLSRRVPSGFRAYSLVIESRLPVAAGDAVDVVFRSQNEGEIPVTLIEGVEILEADLEEERLVVAVRPNEVPLLEKAQQSGKLTVALRSAKEGMTRGKRNARFQKRKIKQQVQLWSEGE